MPDYCAMVFDLKKSRMLANRSQVQQILIESIRTYNAEFQDMLAAPFLIILGDEWQGLLYETADYQETIQYFKSKLELPFYVGIGFGECSVFHRELTVNQLDGPAFYKARHALRLAKEHGYTEVTIR